ncbi:MAG: 30S ribosomal protein S11 [Candidatus Paceibacterota bacterium]|jgi:small subunit ribosomal protein S11
MGKKKVIKQTQEEALKETEEVESKIHKAESKASVMAKQIKKGLITISSTYNNTILTLADANGNVLSWASSGKIGFKGTKKGTPYAAAKAAEVLTQAIEKFRIEEVGVKIKGIGSGRESALRALAGQGVNIVSIIDATPVPHNGCKRKKPRRI